MQERTWHGGGLKPGDLVRLKPQAYGSDTYQGLVMATALAGDGFWTFRRIDVADGRAKLGRKECGYSWYDRSPRRLTDREMHLLLAGEAIPFSEES